MDVLTFPENLYTFSGLSIFCMALFHFAYDKKKLACMTRKL